MKSSGIEALGSAGEFKLKAGVCDMRRMLLVILSAGMCSGLVALETAALAQGAGTPQSDVAALRAEIEALRRLVPSQSHAMADVDYHFSSLWFAGQNGNWPLAAFYLNETRSHLGWAVRIRPVRKLSSGQELDLRPILQSVEGAGLAELKTAIDGGNGKGFDSAYRKTMTECFACHLASEKPYLRPHIPEAPATRMIDLRPNAQ
jgi:hypothetical protein